MYKEGLKALWFWLARWICRVFCILFFRLRAYGRRNVPRRGGFILVSNHQSYLDPIFCGVPLKRHLHFLARDTLFSSKFFACLIYSVNTMPVMQGRSDVSAMRRVIAKLKQGKGVCLFPEGTRSNDGKIGLFKPGFGLLCRRGDASVVPVLVDGAFECWPRHKKIFSPGAVTVCYGKPITTEQVKNMSERELANIVAEKLRQMQSQCRIRPGKAP